MNGSLQDVSQDVPNPQPVPDLSDTDMLMFLAYRLDLIDQIEVENEYEYRAREYYRLKYNPSECAATLVYSHEEYRTDQIDRLLKRNRLKDAFIGAIRSSLFCFFHADSLPSDLQ